MQISAKIDYACRAILELALHWPNKTPLQVTEIASKQHIPIQFLTHILLNLKQLGYVKSVRGKHGGYLLTKAPDRINLKNILIELGMNQFLTVQPTAYKENVIQKIWSEIENEALEKLQQLNFEGIINRKKRSENIASFEI